MFLEIAENAQIVSFRVPAPVMIGDALERLAWELTDACAEIEARIVPPAAVVVSCDGPAFCVSPPQSAADCDAVGNAWPIATRAIANIGPPVIAVIGAEAVGPAWELALACDLRLASAEAAVGSPEIRWGRMPAAGGTQRLARLVGPGVALWLLLRGEVLTSLAALELGLIHRVAPFPELETMLEGVMGGLRTSAPIALAYAKETAHRAGELSLEEGLRLEADLAALLQTTQDRTTGLGSFLQRRPPRFEGR